MSMLQKWNYEKKAYEPYKVPEDWKLKVFSINLAEKVNCCQCGRLATYGTCYTSLEVHTQHGMGYAVCPTCHAVELKREIKVEAESEVE